MNPKNDGPENGSDAMPHKPRAGSSEFHSAAPRHPVASQQLHTSTDTSPYGPAESRTADTAISSDNAQSENYNFVPKRLGLAGWVGEARAYLVEYALVLISIGILLGVVISMLNTILKYNNDEYGYFSSFAYTVSISMIATLMVIIPLILVLTKRINKVEDAAPDIKNRGWRKGFLGFFLLNVGLWGLGFSIAFVYDMISYFASFGITDNNTFPWRSLLANGLGTLILVFTALLYSHDYRNQQVIRPMVVSTHHYGLIAIAIILSLIYMTTAFKDQRASFIDDAISGDLNSIQSKISNYKSDNRGRLPSDLSDIKLNDQQKSRAEKYDYSYKKTSGSYELCAIFKTDTKTKKDTGSQNPLEAFSGSSYPYDDYQSDNSDPYKHGKGNQCFESESYSSDNFPNNRLYDDQTYPEDTLSN